MKNTKIIAFANQKGGVGKTTTLIAVLNYLHKKTNYKFLAVDCDDDQLSLEDASNEKIEMGLMDDAPYQIISIMSNDLPKEISGYIESGEYDFIFVDLPGNLKQPGVISCYVMVDYLFLPTSPAKLDIKSTKRFIKMYNQNVTPTRRNFKRETLFFMFYAKVKANTKTFLKTQKDEDQEDIGVPVMNSYIKDLVTYQDDICEYQIFEDSKPFCEEFVQIMESLITNKK